MNFTEGFGKSWIDRILGKVDKDQGVANAGKVLGIGADGRVTPVEQSGDSGGDNISTAVPIPIPNYGSVVEVDVNLPNSLQGTYNAETNTVALDLLYKNYKYITLRPLYKATSDRQMYEAINNVTHISYSSEDGSNPTVIDAIFTYLCYTLKNTSTLYISPSVMVLSCKVNGNDANFTLPSLQTLGTAIKTGYTHV